MVIERLVRRTTRGLLAAIACVALVSVGGCMGIFSGSRPDNLGLKAGRLAPPNPRPNNVSSQADPKADPEHYVAPLTPRGDPVRAFAQFEEVVRAMPRVTVVRKEPDYLYAEFRSAMMGFVDDVEFALDRRARVIDVRSASRLGYGDLGVNRKRVEAIREALARGEASR